MIAGFVLSTTIPQKHCSTRNDLHCGEMRWCSFCHERIARPKQHTCLQCHREYAKKYRSEHPPTPADRKKANARSYLHVYIKRGKVQKKPCQECGNPNAQGHQHDYDKPLDVTWLCMKCHRRLHNRLQNMQKAANTIKKLMSGRAI